MIDAYNFVKKKVMEAFLVNVVKFFRAATLV